MPPSTLQTASNFLNAKLIGRTLDEARKAVTQEMDEQKTQLDELSSRVVEAGLATWAGSGSTGHLIVRGQAKLLDDVTALSDLERIRALFEALETKEATAPPAGRRQQGRRRADLHRRREHAVQPSPAVR